MENQDFTVVKRLTLFPCIIAGQEGVYSVDETSFKKMFDAGTEKKLKVLNISHSEIEVMKETACISMANELLGMPLTPSGTQTHRSLEVIKKCSQKKPPEKIQEVYQN